jgi:uncharacterized protein
MPQLICPTCRRNVTYTDLTEIPHRPFCGRRCKLVDLGKWLNEEYRISETLSGTENPPPEPPPDPGTKSD